MLEVRDGEVHPVERVRNRDASIRRLAQISHQLGDKERVAVVHGDCLEDAEQLRVELQRLEPGDIPITEIGSVLGTHAGPGVLGVGCILAH
jgi:fatty acid-binding protein DegV